MASRSHYLRALQRKVVAVYLLYDVTYCPKRETWVHDIFQDRDSQSEFILAEEILAGDDAEKCHQYFRMSANQFQFLLELVGPIISKKDTFWRPAITARQRLIITLRFLATGASQVHLSFSFRVGHSTVGKILRETLKAIWECLVTIVMPPPSVQRWLVIAEEFFGVWQLPNCIGAIDGKHIKIKAPANSGSEFYNYKGYFSIVLLAVCDARYKFTLVDIGDSGRHSDGGIFSNSRIGTAFENFALNIPGPRPLPGTDVEAPMFFAGDNAFPLRLGLLKPYPGRLLGDSERIFNYRLSRARRVVENAFGILAARWQIFFRTINADPDLAVQIVQGCVVLHNFLQAPQQGSHFFGDRVGLNGNITLGNWRQYIPSSTNLTQVGNLGSNFHSRSARDVRDKIRNYFLVQGAVPWQWA